MIVVNLPNYFRRMQHRKTLLIALLAVIAFSAAGQETLPLNATRKDSARFYIRQLKEGAIAVRLHSRSAAIEKLKTMGNNQSANAIAAIQREENREIIEAFRTAFSFCKVYFFFSDSTDALLQGARTGFFVDDSLKINPAISLDEKFFMVADEGNPNLYQKYDRTQPNIDYGERGYLNETIFLLDQNLKPLKSPFPRYAPGKLVGGTWPNYWIGKVRTLNAKLLSFYNNSL
jgi:hypothetical protein